MPIMYQKQTPFLSRDRMSMKVKNKPSYSSKINSYQMLTQILGKYSNFQRMQKDKNNRKPKPHNCVPASHQ